MHSNKTVFSDALSFEEARQIQVQLRKKLILEDRYDTINIVAGIDAGFPQNHSTIKAAIVLLSYPQLELIEQVVESQSVTFPYVTGYLSFREIPAIYRAFQKLRQKPDILICDGQGIAHPRRFGIASHLGVLCDLPAIGVAKSRLLGRHGPLAQKKGDWQPLLDKGEVIGAVLRSRELVKPIYVSAGHKVSLESALSITMNCITKYRLPETTRYAHKLASG